MLNRVLDAVGLPILGGLSLILVVVVWYVLGNRAGKIAMIAGAAMLALRQYRENILLKEKAKKDAQDLKAISRADKIRRESRKHSDAGGLREPDEFNRD